MARQRFPGKRPRTANQLRRYADDLREAASIAEVNELKAHIDHQHVVEKESASTPLSPTCKPSVIASHQQTSNEREQSPSPSTSTETPTVITVPSDSEDDDLDSKVSRRPWRQPYWTNATRRIHEESFMSIHSVPLHGSWIHTEVYQELRDQELQRYVQDYPFAQWTIGEGRAKQAYSMSLQRWAARRRGERIYNAATIEGLTRAALAGTSPASSEKEARLGQRPMRDRHRGKGDACRRETGVIAIDDDSDCMIIETKSTSIAAKRRKFGNARRLSATSRDA